MSEFLKKGMEHFTAEAPEGFKPLPEVKEGCHKLQFFIKGENGKVKECRFKATKRCKKLLALSEKTCQLIEERGSLDVSPQELLSFFSGEKERKKMEERVKIVERALKG